MKAVLEALFALGSYFVPTIIAFARGSAAKWRVAVVNFFLGWTIIGWIVALVMALPGHDEK